MVDDIPMVKLRNGSTEPEHIVTETMEQLKRLSEQRPAILTMLLLMCRNPNYRPPDDFSRILYNKGLLTGDNSVPENIRNVVLSSFEKDRFRLISPIAPN